MSQFMKQIIKYAERYHKSGESTSNQVQSWTIRDSSPSRNRMTNNKVTGTFTLLMALGIGIFLNSNANAAQYSLTLSINNTTPTVNVSPTTTGAFAKSDDVTISASTTNATGYTLGIKATSATDYGKLSSTNSSLLSIEEATTEEQFKALDADPDTYNNRWGYKPQKLNSSVNTAYLPAPNATTGDIIETTNTANSTANTYTLALGARVDSNMSIGAYSNTYIVTLVAEAVPYTITYIDNTIANFPVDVSDKTSATTVQISSNTPTRNGYTFLGWCTVTPTNNANGTDTCSGTQYAAGANLTIDQTGGSNNFNLYAMWSGNYTIGALTYLQDFSSLSVDGKDRVKASMVEGEQYQLRDNRDNNTYWIAKQADGKIWMTQNLDLCIGCSGTAALTSNNTDLNTYGSNIYATNYSTSNGIITWSPPSTAITSNHVASNASNGASVSNWTGSQVYPYSAEGGTSYIYTSGSTSNDTIYNNLNTCIDDKGSNAGCEHYHRGNYYNWTAAIASSDSTDISTRYATAENSICPAGWRLPKGLSSATLVADNAEYAQLMFRSGVISTLSTRTSYSDNGLEKVRTSPLFFVRSGGVNDSKQTYSVSADGYYWTSSCDGNNTTSSFGLNFTTSIMVAPNGNGRQTGESVRCLLR